MSENDGQWDGPGLDAWSAWEPTDIARRLAGVPIVWCVVGGWSIDLFLGERTREHEDLEIATIATDLVALRRQLEELAFHSVGDGNVRRLADGELGPASNHQHWGLDEGAGLWRIDVMVEPGDADRWVFRRDARVSAPRSEMVAMTADGVPYLRPHGTLLYKAKANRDKDPADFNAVVDHLTDDERAWLREAIALVHPGHPWLPRLAID